MWFGAFTAIVLILVAAYAVKASKWTENKSSLPGASQTSNSVSVKGDPNAAPQILWFTWKRVVMRVDAPQPIYVGWQSPGAKPQYYRKAIRPNKDGYFALRIGPGDVKFIVLGAGGQPAPNVSLVAVTGDDTKYKNVPLL